MIISEKKKKVQESDSGRSGSGSSDDDFELPKNGIKYSVVQNIVQEKKDQSYLKGIENLDALKKIIAPLGAFDISALVWRVMEINLDTCMKTQLEGSKFQFEPNQHRFPDTYPFDFNAMTGHIGSWMGDMFGLMQWPMPGHPYKKILRHVIQENNVGMIVALGKREKNQRVEMTAYWKKLGLSWKKPTKKLGCNIHNIEDIPDLKSPKDKKKYHKCVVYHFRDWPDRGTPSQEHIDFFEFLFSKIKEMEEEKKQVIVHCRAGVGRSGSLRLMYYAWKKEINSDNLVEEFNKQRALRMWAVQTHVQYVFVQNYIRKVEEKKSVQKSYRDMGDDYYEKKEYPQAMFYYWKYGKFGTGMFCPKIRLVDQKISKEYKGLLNWMDRQGQRSMILPQSAWEEVHNNYKKTTNYTNPDEF